MSDTRGRFWLCQACGRHVPARLVECRCGFARTAAAPTLAPAEPATADAGPSWFAVGPGKLIAMSVVTLGLYQLYWFYQQWRRVRDGGENVSVVARSLFGVLFSYSLFRRVIASAPDAAPAAGAGALAVLYGLLCISSRLPLPFAAIALLSVLPLAAIQRIASAVAEHDFPAADPNRRLTAANWVAVVAGSAFLAFVSHGVLVREKPTSLAYLSRVAAEANKAPRGQATEGTVLDRVVAQEGRLVYHYTVAGEAQGRLAERKVHLKDLLKPSICRDPLLKEGVTVRFVYNGASAGQLATVEIAPHDCRR